MRDPEIGVLIVGAGPVGLFLAAELVRHGVRPRIVERRATVAPYSRAIAIQPRTLEVMEASGLTRRFEQVGLRAKKARIVVGGQRTDLAVADLDSTYPHVLMLLQSETERLLAEHLESHGVRIERGREVMLISADDEGVDVTIQGTEGFEEVRANYVIGCDGAQSTVRRQSSIDWGADELPMKFAIADVDLDWGAARDEAALFMSRHGLCALFPLPGGAHRWRVLADVPKAVHEATLTSIATLLRERAGIDAVPEHPSTLMVLSSGEQLASSFRSGRILLVGDAAHIHSPIGGQGMNTGLQDAHNLAWKLALVVNRHVNPALLDSYEAERRPIAERVLRDTHQATQAATVRGLLPQVLRMSAVGLLAGIDIVQRSLLDRTAELDVSYRRSPIVTAGLCGGDRLPDLRWGLQGSLTRLLGTKHLVLLFDGGSAKPQDQSHLLHIADVLVTRFDGWLESYAVLHVDERPEGIERGARYLLDAAGAIHRHLSIQKPTAIVVRPDGYIGYQGEPELVRILAHLERILGA